jgi:hypothetical protein
MFVNFTRCLPDNPPSHWGGIAIADIDGDGRFELLVAGKAGPNRALKWSGTQLRDIAAPILADPDHPTIRIAAGDLDCDGNEEIYLLGGAGSSDRLLKRDLDGQWVDLLPGRTESAGGSLTVIDRRGAGRYGIVIVSPGQAARHLECGFDGAPVDLARSLGLATPAHFILAVPLLGARTDLICATDAGKCIYRNVGDGTFEECAADLNLADAAEDGGIVGAVDHGGGQLALAYGNRDGPHRLMARTAEGRWSDCATPALALPSSIRVLCAADFDNDGCEELFFNNSAEPNRLFRLSRSEGPVLIDLGDAAEPDGQGSACTAADIDGDGVLELIVAHGESNAQPVAIYKARSARGNGWLRIRPLTRFGAPARGALVRASLEGRIAVKFIEGIGEPVAHFGLGKGATVDWVDVAWPDGAELRLPRPDVNCTYRVPYPQG